MEKSALESVLQSIEKWQIFCALLVALGVAGEFVCSFLASSRNKQLQEISRDEDSKLQLQIQQLKKNNLELETNLAPRIFSNQGTTNENLKKFAGTRAFIE